MSAISGSRAAVFTQQSQSVEVYLEGAWWPGSLLGWRHDDGGACEVWVRVTVDGADREAWTDLAEVRLPEARSAAALAPDARVDLFAGPAEELLPGSSAAPLLSLSEAAAREQWVAGVLPASGPATARRRRRHGGDVTAETPAVHDGSAAGRHRAPAAAGRHRAADATAPDDQSRGEVADATVLMPRVTEADCLTRPMRLGDRAARARLARPDAALPA